MMNKFGVPSSKCRALAGSFAVALCTLNSEPAAAQDTLRLADLQDAAIATDPRAAQAALRLRASELRLRDLAAERLPQLAVSGQATRQSEVSSIPIRLPDAIPPEPPKERWEALLGVEQRLLDPTAAPRAEVERARLQVERAELSAALHPLRAEATEAFFSAWLLQARLAESRTLADDLEARLTVARAAWREGAALAGDTAALRAELLRVEVEREGIAAGRRAALAVLADLTGRPVDEGSVLLLPGLDAAVARARETAGPARDHPQLAVLAASRARLEREAEVAESRARPRIAAFGQLGYGVPGYRQFTDHPHEYWLAGVRLSWTPWSWGTTGRERELIELQRRTLETEEAALAARLGRQVQDDLHAIDRLRAALAVDERIIALREQVERQARAQLDERVITPADYVDARTDLQEARLARERHAAELARAAADYLTTLGIPLR